MTDSYVWYNSDTDEEEEIDSEKVEALARVLRKVTETETDSDHIHSALQDFVELNSTIYGTVWPDKEPTTKDVKIAIDVAELFSIDYLPENLKKMSQYYNSELPSPMFTTQIVDASGTVIAEEQAPGIDGASILMEYDTVIESVDWSEYTVTYTREEREE